MKKVVMSFVVAIFIMIIIPFIIVELLPPKNSADSTKPLHTPAVTDTAV